MNILLIDHYAGSPSYGMEFRPYYMAREWLRLGHRVAVVAADFSHLRARNPRVERDFSEQPADGVPYLWVKTPRYHGNGPGRAANMAAFCGKLWHASGRLAREYRPDAVIASSTYPFDSYPAARIAKLSGGRFYFELHDLWPLTQIELYGLSERNPYVRLLQRAEDYAYREAAQVISVLPRADIHLSERGIPRGKFVHIPNGIVPEEARTESEGIAEEYVRLLCNLREQGKFIVMYLGGFATANALDELIEAAPRMGPDTEVVLVGGGPRRAELAAKAAGERNIRFLDAVPRAQVQGLLHLADCLYIGAKRCGLYRYGVGMNKLYDYMLASRPILCGIETADNEVAAARCGLTIPAQDPEAIVRAVRTLRALPAAEREAMGLRGRQYVLQCHDYRQLAARFADILKTGA